MALKDDYKDDILDVSVNTKRKYRMTENQDGTVSFDDETVYTQEGDSFGASDINAITEAVNNNSGMPVGTIATFDGTTLPSGFEPYQTEEQRAIAQINDNLSGFKFYPTGTGIVGLISDDSAYTDEDGNYVIWGTATANQLVADNPNTYKSVPSTEDCRGEVGADSASPFSGKSKVLDWLFNFYSKETNVVVCNSFDGDYKYILFPLPFGTNTNVKLNGVSVLSQVVKLASPPSPSCNSPELVKLKISQGDKLEIASPQYERGDYVVLGTNGEPNVVATYQLTTQGSSSTFVATKKYKKLYAYVSQRGYMKLSASSMNIHPLAIPYDTQNVPEARFFQFNNVEVGDTITFSAQYASNASLSCLFEIK